MDRWPIDDLARLADLTVDTIRYYQREGLLPRPERDGRRSFYGRAHLERLDQIRALQEKRFSLAAIKALLDAGTPGIIDGLFIGDRDRYGDVAALAERSGADPGLIGSLTEIGLLRPPDDLGREAYDGADLAVVRVVRELDELGLPREVLVDLLREYVLGVEEMQRRAVDMLARRLDPSLGAPETALLETVTRASGHLAAGTEQVLAYLHRRVVQRLALERMRGSSNPG